MLEQVDGYKGGRKKGPPLPSCEEIVAALAVGHVRLSRHLRVAKSHERTGDPS